MTPTVALTVNHFAQRLKEQSISLRRGRPEILQVNVGKLCNLTCVHCHVNAGPKRKEIMTRETVDRIIDWLANTDIPTVDLTGGAPEMIPDFRYFIERVKELQPSRHVIDRCNLTILLEDGYRDLAEFLAGKEVEIIASMPCYSADKCECATRGGRIRRQHRGAATSELVRLRNRSSVAVASRLQSGRRVFASRRKRSLRPITNGSCKSISELCSTGFTRLRIFRSAGLPLTCATAIGSMSTCNF